jgi:exopolyphosphatase/guanosine-5'-triphosphate,3'-diphosphate pyrophosphatase
MPADTIRVGVVEVGSRAVRLLVADVAGGAVRPVVTRSQETHLIATVEQPPAARDRTLDSTADAISRFIDVAAAQGAARTSAFGTEAVRRLAARGLIPAGSSLSRLRVLTEEEEALCAARAALSGLDGKERGAGPGLVVDQGGGSLDIAVVRRDRPMALLASASLDLGSDRLTRQFAATGHDLPGFRSALEAQIQAPIPEQAFSISVAQGSVATKCAWLSLSTKRGNRYDPRLVQGVELGIGSLGTMVSLFAQRPYAQWESLRAIFDPGNPASDEMERIVTGAVALSAVLKSLGVTRFTVSALGVRHGMALELAGAGC